MEDCAFCAEPSVVQCMNRSLRHKYADHQTALNHILSGVNNSTFIRYKQAIMESDSRELMNEYIKKGVSNRYKTFQQLQQYYMYRIYVPVFRRSSAADTVLSYYFEKQKHYYNCIKRKLHITVDPSESSYVSRINTPSKDYQPDFELLGQIKKEMQEQKKKAVPQIVQFKTQSKALQELVFYLKLNKKIEHVQSLHTEDCIDQQQMTQKINKAKIISASQKIQMSNRLFKKNIHISSRKNLQEIEVSKQKMPSRSKSIKVVKWQQNGQTSSGRTTPMPFRVKHTPPKNKQTSSLTILPKRNSSLTKIAVNFSPYQKKNAVEKRKNTVQIQKSVRTLTVSHVRGRDSEETKARQQEVRMKKQQERIRESLGKMRRLKVQKGGISHTTPNSPANKPNQCVQIGHQDNILSIRKKKLQILKQKTSRK